VGGGKEGGWGGKEEGQLQQTTFDEVNIGGLISLVSQS
jgi:hypothetical protein